MMYVQWGIRAAQGQFDDDRYNSGWAMLGSDKHGAGLYLSGGTFVWLLRAINKVLGILTWFG